MMVGRYGQPFILENGAEAVIKTNIPASQMLENETVHCMPCGSRTENGKEYVYYKVFRGSSTYDTKEMSILVSGVVSECQEQGDRNNATRRTGKDVKNVEGIWQWQDIKTAGG